MIRFRLRPTFEIALKDSRQEAIKKLKQHCDYLARGRWFRMTGEYGELHLDDQETRLWSPHLSFYIVEAVHPLGLNEAPAQSDESLMRVRFAPRFEVWTFVWAVYLAMSFSAFFGSALAYSQWMLGETPWGVYVVLAAILVIVTLHIVASTGQHWSSDQMEELRGRLEGIVHDSGLVYEEDAPALHRAQI